MFATGQIVKLVSEIAVIGASDRINNQAHDREITHDGDTRCFVGECLMSAIFHVFSSEHSKWYSGAHSSNIRCSEQNCFFCFWLLLLGMLPILQEKFFCFLCRF